MFITLVKYKLMMVSLRGFPFNHKTLVCASTIQLSRRQHAYKVNDYDEWLTNLTCLQVWQDISITLVDHF